MNLQDEEESDSQSSNRKYSFSNMSEEYPINFSTLQLSAPQQLISAKGHIVTLIASDSKLKHNHFELFVSNLRIIFQEQRIGKIEFYIPHGYIRNHTFQNQKLSIVLKTGLKYLFAINDSSEDELSNKIVSAFEFLPFSKLFPKKSNSLFQYLRQANREKLNWQSYVVVDNKDGKICSAYPRKFIVPRTVTFDLLAESSRNREFGKLPILSYYDETKGGSLWRGSRIKLGFEEKRFNRAYLNEISRNLQVFEYSEEQLKNPCKDVRYIIIDSGSSLQILYEKLVVGYARDENILKLFANWFQAIWCLIRESYRISQLIVTGFQVLLQQKTGCDRVAQIGALTQIILDPYFRTIEGFGTLIEKEFSWFGHPFRKRLGFERQRFCQASPIFIQFLDCVHQLLSAHPTAFQFNGIFLARIGYELYTTRYSNFQFNSSLQKQASGSGNSNIWQDLRGKVYQNYIYQHVESKCLTEIRRILSIKQLIVWRQFWDLITTMTSVK